MQFDLNVILYSHKIAAPLVPPKWNHFRLVFLHFLQKDVCLVPLSFFTCSKVKVNETELCSLMHSNTRTAEKDHGARHRRKQKARVEAAKLNTFFCAFQR